MPTSVDTNQKAAPRRPALDRPTAMRLAAEEYDRVVAQLRALTPEEWTRPTDCPAWDVRALACHMLGMAEMSASIREQMRQMRTAKKAGGVFIDALTGLQVAERTGLTPARIIERFAVVGPKAAVGRRRTPGFVRRRAMPDAQPVGAKATSPSERWTLGYLVDVILTRDPWMHRADIAAVTNAPMVLTGEHDGALVADVAREWATRHGRPVTLELTGPAGGSWTWGSGGPTLTLDAVEFCRVLSGRGDADGLLAVEVPF
jgi:uncharacterized protein (TIGR03083 family)